MTVSLPRQAAVALARSAGCKLGKNINGDTWVDVPREKQARLYSRSNRASDIFDVRSIRDLETDLVAIAEERLGITITRTPPTEAQAAAIASLKDQITGEAEASVMNGPTTCPNCGNSQGWNGHPYRACDKVKSCGSCKHPETDHTDGQCWGTHAVEGWALRQPCTCERKF